MRFPDVARRSPATITPSAYLVATTVVPWVMSRSLPISATAHLAPFRTKPLALEKTGETRTRVIVNAEVGQAHWPPFWM